MSRIRNLLEAEGRRCDHPNCGKLVYQFGHFVEWSMGTGQTIVQEPRYYDASGLPHACEMERVSPMAKK